MGSEMCIRDRCQCCFGQHRRSSLSALPRPLLACKNLEQIEYADVAELADALDSGSSEHYAHASSSLVIRITKIVKGLEHLQTLYFLSGACLKNALILIFQTSYSIIPLY